MFLIHEKIIQINHKMIYNKVFYVIWLQFQFRVLKFKIYFFTFSLAQKPLS